MAGMIHFSVFPDGAAAVFHQSVVDLPLDLHSHGYLDQLIQVFLQRSRWPLRQVTPRGQNQELQDFWDRLGRHFVQVMKAPTT
jgi:hypothetical protein